MWPALVARLVPYRTLAVIAVFAVTATGLFVQTVRLDACRESVAAKALVAESTAAIMSAQNAGIEALKAESATREVASKKALEAVERQRNTAEKTLSRIRSAAVPASCEGATAWAADQARSLSRGWE